ITATVMSKNMMTALTPYRVRNSIARSLRRTAFQVAILFKSQRFKCVRKVCDHIGRRHTMCRLFLGGEVARKSMQMHGAPRCFQSPVGRLREQAYDHPRQHIACASGREADVASGIDIGGSIAIDRLDRFAFYYYDAS